MRRGARKKEGRIFYELREKFAVFKISEMEKAIEICRLLRVENVPGFRYIKHAVISSDPEGDAIGRIFSIVRSCNMYAAIHIEKPFENPFAPIPNGYKTLMVYMRVNALEYTDKDVIPCFETDGDSMDIYIACK